MTLAEPIRAARRAASRRNTVAIPILAAAVGLASVPASAATVYRYSGQTFESATEPFTTSHRVTATVTLDGPIIPPEVFRLNAPAPDIRDLPGFRLELSAGDLLLSSDDGTLERANLIMLPDNSIYSWYFVLVNDDRERIVTLYRPRDFLTRDYALSDFEPLASSLTEPGVWSCEGDCLPAEVPVPPAFVMLASALALVVGRRKRSRRRFATDRNTIRSPSGNSCGFTLVPK